MIQTSTQLHDNYRFFIRNMQNKDLNTSRGGGVSTKNIDVEVEKYLKNIFRCVKEH